MRVNWSGMVLVRVARTKRPAMVCKESVETPRDARCLPVEAPVWGLRSGNQPLGSFTRVEGESLGFVRVEDIKKGTAA